MFRFDKINITLKYQSTHFFNYNVIKLSILITKKGKYYQVYKIVLINLKGFL